ncbi:MAG: SDR family oxidoreductase [Trueperaceae bacterium]|nr:SDR family oxidoreductase [Trueperaceae bacterium]
MRHHHHTLITGASSGIGAAFARHLAANKTNLTLIARREDKLRALAESLEAHADVRVTVLQADLTDEDDISAVERYIRDQPDLDLLINNAGFGTQGAFYEVALDRHLAMLRLHVEASVRLCYAVLPKMIERDYGGIVNVASVAAFLPSPGNTTYSATKDYLNVFSESLRREVAAHHIAVQSLCPGFTYSEFHDTDEFADFDRGDLPGFLWMTSDAVAQRSLGNLGSGGAVYIPGWQNRLLVRLLKTPLLREVLVWGRRRMRSL